MKRVLSFSLVLSFSFIGFLLIPFTGLAQSKWELGVRFIPQATTFRYTQGAGTLVDFLKVSSPYYSRMRTAQGIGITYNPFKRVHLGAGLLYSLQGGGYAQRKTNLNYIKLPISLGLNSAARRRLIFTIESGIELSYLVRAKNVYADDQKKDIRGYVRKVSWGIPFAMGVKFKVLHSYLITTQLYMYTDLNTLSKTNKNFGAYNYVYPGLRICIDQNLECFKKKK